MRFKRITTLLLIMLTLLCGCAREHQDEITAQPQPEQQEQYIDNYEKPNYPYVEPKEPIPLPVLMYHHFQKEPAQPNSTIVSEDSFRKQMTALKEAGYTTITPHELDEFMSKKAGLPEKPILITMDDGYLSNLDIAAPILHELNMNATVFITGINLGRDSNPHTNVKFEQPRIDWPQANKWVRNGTIVLQSHTYDMHQKASQGISGRDGSYPKENESEQDYVAALRRDASLAKLTVEGRLFTRHVAIAYPYGFHSEISSREFARSGARLLFTSVYGISFIEPKENYEYQLFKRWAIGDEITGEMLVNRIETLSAQKPNVTETK